MWLRKIQRKRKQYSLIAIVVLFSAAILAGCVSFIVGMSSSTDEYFEDCADMFSCYYEGEGTEAFTKAVGKEENIEITSEYKAAELNENIKINGESFTPFYMMLGAMNDYKEHDICFNIYEGKDKKAPADGEIWVDKIFATDKHIKTGDTITINGEKLSVSAIYRWAFRPASTYSISTFFVSENTLEQASKGYKQLTCFFSKSDMDQSEKLAFAEKIDGQFYNMTKEDMKTGVSSMVLIVGGMGALAAVMVFIASVIVISFVIKNNIAEEFKTIGIHKALGDLSSTIKGFYVKSYVFVGAIGIFVGSLAGIPIAKVLQDKYATHMREVELSPAMVLTAVGCGVLLLAVLSMCLMVVLRRIKRITPVEAIRMGMTSSKKKIRKSLFKNANTSFVMAVNDIFKKRGNSIMMLLMLTVSVFLSVFFVNMDYSTRAMGKNRNRWFSIPKSDAMLTGSITDEVLTYLEENKYVDEFYTANLFSLWDVEAVNKDEKKAFVEYLAETQVVNCSDWDEKKTGVRPIKGETPKKANEVMFGELILEASGYEIGDYVPLRIEGEEKEFLITGAYASMLSGGNSISFTNDIYDITKQDENFTEVFVNFEKEEDYKAFKKDMKEKYPDVTVEIVMEAITSAANGVIAMVSPVTSIMVIVFVIFSITIIIILLEMEQQNNRYQYGILKALGRTNGYLCRKMYWKVGILSILGIGFGVGLNHIGSAPIFKSMVGVDAFIMDANSTLAILGVIVLTIIGVTALFCLPLRKVSPKELMEE